MYDDLNNKKAIENGQTGSRTRGVHQAVTWVRNDIEHRGIGTRGNHKITSYLYFTKQDFVVKDMVPEKINHKLV